MASDQARPEPICLIMMELPAGITLVPTSTELLAAERHPLPPKKPPNGYD